MITQEEILEAARESAQSGQHQFSNDGIYEAHLEGFQEGAQWAINLMLERAAIGFEVNFRVLLVHLQEGGHWTNAAVIDLHKKEFEILWRAATIASEKRIKKLEIERLHYMGETNTRNNMLHEMNSQLSQSQKRIKELEEECSRQYALVSQVGMEKNTLKTQLSQSQKREEVMRKALEFYASTKSWRTYLSSQAHDETTSIIDDSEVLTESAWKSWREAFVTEWFGGKRARAAIKEAEEIE